MENSNSIEDIKLSADFYLCREDKVLIDTLILDYDRLLREVKDNALSFNSKSDYVDFVKKVEANKEKISERLIGNFVEKIIDLNAGISEEQLANLVARQFTVIKYRNVVTDRKIQRIYRDAIDKYLKKISKLDMEWLSESIFK